MNLAFLADANSASPRLPFDVSVRLRERVDGHESRPMQLPHAVILCQHSVKANKSELMSVMEDC